MFGGGTVDAWCLQCDKESTFHLKDQSKTRELPTSTEKPRRILLDEVVIVEASCTRESTSPYAIRRYQGNRCGFPFVCIMLKHQRIITKIGQSPSAFDIEKRRIDQDLLVELQKHDRRDLERAIMLHAHSVGIGSFVYIRRIIEHLVEDAHQLAKRKVDWDEDKYMKSRFEDRISMLDGFLPRSVVQSAGMYGILSKHIHDLSDEECLENFPLMRRVIEFILKERHQQHLFDKSVKDVQRKRAAMKAQSKR